jgi:uncharacterized protein (TIRG00374 family)
VTDPVTPDRAAGQRSGRLGRVVRAGVSIGLILLLAWFVDLKRMAAVLSSADIRLLGLAALIVLVDRALMIGKWYPLLKAQKLGISLARAARVYLAASFASTLLPSSVGGELLRTFALGGERHAALEVGASIVVERMLGLVASAIACTSVLLLALSQGFQLGFLLPWILALGVVPAVAVSVALWPIPGRWLARYRERRWFQLVRRFAFACTLYRHHAGTLAVVGLLSLVEQAMPIAVFWVLTYAFELGVSPFALLVAVPLTLFIGRLPIAIAGIGVIEGALIYFLGIFGVPPADALSLALGGRFVEILGLLPGGLFWSSLVWVRAS